MPLIKVVEYLEPMMAKELLGKFPDNSAFDFDYTQSSIWSPLAPRPYKSLEYPPFTLNISSSFDLDSLDSDAGSCADAEGVVSGTPEPPRCMAKYNGFGLITRRAMKRVSSNLKNMATSTAMNLNLGNKKFKKKNKIQDLCAPHMLPLMPTPPSATKRGRWAKVLKVASKQFKNKKKKDAVQLGQGHLKLPNYQRQPAS